MAQRNGAGRAFTLVELLIVIGIIAALLGVVLPAIATARLHARHVGCLANLRQIGVLMQSYAADNGGEIPVVYGLDEAGRLRPMGRSNVGVRDHGRGIGGMLLLVGKPVGMADHGYCASADPFLCPSDPEISNRGLNDFIAIDGPKNIRRMSYAYCYVPAGGSSYNWWEYDPDTGKRFKGGGFPTWDAKALARYERHSLTQRNAASAAVMYEPPVFADARRARPPQFHSDGGNVLYLDGHVKEVPLHVLAPPPPGADPFDPIKQKLSILEGDAGVQ